MQTKKTTTKKAPLPAVETDALLEHVETTRAKRRKSKRTPMTPPGSVTELRRMFKGREIVVRITDAGFEYEGETYTSASAVAKHITGYSISGPVFFKLVEPKATAEAHQP